MADQDQLLKIIFTAIDDLNEQLPEDAQLLKDPDTSLYGSTGSLDSISLVNLIVGIEQGIEDILEKSVILADDRAMSQKHSPFADVKSLLYYINELVDAKSSE